MTKPPPDEIGHSDFIAVLIRLLIALAVILTLCLGVSMMPQDMRPLKVEHKQ